MCERCAPSLFFCLSSCFCSTVKHLARGLGGDMGAREGDEMFEVLFLRCKSGVMVSITKRQPIRASSVRWTWASESEKAKISDFGFDRQ